MAECPKSQEEGGTGIITLYLYEASRIVLEQDGQGNQTAWNVYGTNLIMRKAGADALTYMYNGHADVTALLDSNGNLVATYYYDAFGNILEKTGTADNCILYGGYQYDEERGFTISNGNSGASKRNTGSNNSSSGSNSAVPTSQNVFVIQPNTTLAEIAKSGIWRHYDPSAEGFYKAQQMFLLWYWGTDTINRIGDGYSVNNAGWLVVAMDGKQGKGADLSKLTVQEMDNWYNEVNRAAFGVTSVAVMAYSAYTIYTVEKNATYSNITKQATINANSKEVVLGKYSEGGVSYVKVAQERGAPYFQIDNWDDVVTKVGEKNIWSINETFIQQQANANKTLILSHDPTQATGYYANEVNLLKGMGYSFIQEGSVWRAFK